MAVTQKPALSVTGQFQGRSVLLTGGTGFIGGLVLESLLRTTDVAKVYVLLRSKGTDSANQRLKQLLQRNIFHQVRDKQQLLSKATALEADVTLPDLGLSATQYADIQQQLHIIIHCAADIRLEVNIHSALKTNYGGTQAVLQLACGCKQLAALVHTSSCFVNMNQPCSSVVLEQLYPLQFGNKTVDCRELVQDLLSLPEEAADVRAKALYTRCKFPNSYTFSKHLAEQLVGHYQQQGLPAAIVRPSLVCAIAYQPIPGHVGNWAGPIGASAALALGFYHSLHCVSSQPLHVWDIIPADLVVNAILATAAATAAGVASEIAADAAAAATCCGTSSAAANEVPMKQQLLIVQSSSTSTYPVTLMEGWNHAVEFIRAHKPKFTLSCGKLPTMTAAFQPDPLVVRRERRWTACKVFLACCLLRLFGMKRAAVRLQSGFEALCIYGTSKIDRDLVFSAKSLQLLNSRLTTAEQQQYPLVMRPGMALPMPINQQPTTDISKQHDPHTDKQQLLTSEPKVQAVIADGQQHPQQVLTWRRYFHSQLAAVYYHLYRLKVPQSAQGVTAVAPLIEHDFVPIC